MFRFGASEFLFGLVSVPAAALFFYFVARQTDHTLAAFGDSALMERLTATVNRSGRLAKRILVVVVLGLLVFALARPQFGTRVETVKREGLDVIVAIDVSRSMLAEDIAPNRLEKAKFTVSTLIRRLDGDRVGLVAFAGEAFVQSPLTLDYAAALLFLNAMEPDIVSVQGTDLGAALQTALDAFDAGTNQHRALIVITDGEDHERGIDDAVERATDEGVRILAVGMGTPAGVPVPQFDAAGRRTGFMRDEGGNVITSVLDETTLVRIVEETSGQYYRASPRGSELDELVEELTGETGRELESLEVTQFEEQFQIFVGLGLLLLIAEMLIPDRRTVRQTWAGRVR